jgi:hypothetical protein
MKMKIIKISIILMILMQASFAEEKQGGLWDFFAKIGINLGGTMPRPMPSSISKVESYRPSLAPTIETETLRWLSKKIGVSTGLRFENKGMKSTALVKEYSMNIEKFHGKFRGIVDTEMNFNYLGLPILAHYAFTENFSVYAGAYYAYLLSGEFKGSTSEGILNSGSFPTPIDRGEYDFSNELRNYDVGLSIGLNFLPYNEHFLFSFDFNYGLVSVFPSDFNGISDDMQNVYGKISIGYLF